MKKPQHNHSPEHQAPSDTLGSQALAPAREPLQNQTEDWGRGSAQRLWSKGAGPSISGAQALLCTFHCTRQIPGVRPLGAQQPQTQQAKVSGARRPRNSRGGFSPLTQAQPPAPLQTSSLRNFYRRLFLFSLSHFTLTPGRTQPG